MTGDDKKSGKKLDLQDNDGNDSSKIGETIDIIENVLVKKPTLPVDVTPKKTVTEKMDHISNENIPGIIKSVDEELDTVIEADIDSHSTIICDISENNPTNNVDLSMPNTLLTSKVETPMASPLASTDKHTRIVLENKISLTKLESKPLGSKTKKPGAQETEKVLRTKKVKK